MSSDSKNDSSDSKSTNNSKNDSDDDDDSPEIKKPPKVKYIFNYGRDLEPKFNNPSIAGYYRPWRFTDKRTSGVSKVYYARIREFRTSLDVSSFPHENILVKVVDNFVVIEGFHNKIEDQLGKIRRYFTRKYKTPPDVKLSTIHGKYKKGYLYLWGDRIFEEVEKSDVAEVDENSKNDRIVAEKNPVREKPRQLAQDDVKQVFDDRLDKRQDARNRQKTEKIRNEKIIPIEYSPESS